jgi:hypothetical protein
MVRIGLLTAVIAIAGLALPAGDAQAGWNNRTDILDVNDGTSFFTSLGGTGYRSWAFASADTNGGDVFGSGSGSVFTQNNRVQIETALYQPDSAKRTSKKQTLSQKNFAWIQIFTSIGPYTSSTRSGYIDGCKAKSTATDKDKNGVYNVSATSGSDQLKYSFKCPKDVLSTLGFSAAQQALIQAFIGKTTTVKIKFPR